MRNLPSPLRIVVALGGMCFYGSDGLAGFSGVEVTPNARQAMLVGAATVGWSFTANSDLTLTDLGYFDYGGNGLGEAHQVAIWDDTGALLGSTTVPTNGILIDGFRYATVPAIDLEGGRSYVIAGFQSNQSLPQLIDGLALGSFSSSSAISYGGSLTEFNSTFARPVYDSIEIGGTAVGPNFRATENVANATAIPEPGTAICGLALTLVGLVHRRRLV